MRLTWKDGAATVLTAGAVALYAGFRADADAPLLSSTRLVAAAVLVLGLIACGVGGSAVAATPGETPAGVRLLGVLGGITLVAGLAVVITGNDAALALLVAATVVLWLAATGRHLLAGGSHRTGTTMAGTPT